MKDWKKIASGSDLEIPAADLERILPALETVEAAFRPLTAQLDDALDPAPVFRATEDGE